MMITTMIMEINGMMTVTVLPIQKQTLKTSKKKFDTACQMCYNRCMKQHYLTTDYVLCNSLIKKVGIDELKELVVKYIDAVRASIHWQKEAEELQEMLDVAYAENLILKKETNK